MIDGVKIKELLTHADDRGFFREVFRTDWGMGEIAQTSVTLTFPGIIKAFHYHKLQTDMWYVAQGQARVVLHDLRPDSPTKGQTEVIFCGEHKPLLIAIPPMVAHGYQVLGDTPIVLFYHTSVLYDAKNPDEHRIPFDDATIGYDWSIKNQ